MKKITANYTIVGVTFDNRQKILNDFYKEYHHGKKYCIDLNLEDNNPYDHNAVAVILHDDGGNCHHIGYISKGENQIIRKKYNSISESYLASIGPNRNGVIGGNITVVYEENENSSHNEEIFQTMVSDFGYEKDETDETKIKKEYNILSFLITALPDDTISCTVFIRDPSIEKTYYTIHPFSSFDMNLFSAWLSNDLIKELSHTPGIPDETMKKALIDIAGYSIEIKNSIK